MQKIAYHVRRTKLVLHIKLTHYRNFFRHAPNQFPLQSPLAIPVSYAYQRPKQTLKMPAPACKP